MIVNPPTTLSVENIKDTKDPTSSIFQTKTTINLTMRYIPLSTQL